MAREDDVVAAAEEILAEAAAADESDDKANASSPEAEAAAAGDATAAKADEAGAAAAGAGSAAGSSTTAGTGNGADSSTPVGAGSRPPADGSQAGQPAGGSAAEADATASDASAALAAAQAAEQEWRDKFMRLHAEWDTYRRRTNEQRAEEKKRATEGLVEGLIPVLDDFERSIAYAQENGEAGLLEGVQKVHQKFVEVLQKAGVEVIDPAGRPFDALEAQAVATVPDDQEFDETVREVYQKGYKMGTKVIRSAMVTVTTGGPKRPAEETE